MKEKSQIYMGLIQKLYIDGLLKDSRSIRVSKSNIILFLLGGGRKIRDPDMENKLLNWFEIYHKTTGNKVTTKEFKKMALFYSKDKTFRASKGWLQKFRRRHKIKLN